MSDVIDNINNGKYENKLPYSPERDQLIVLDAENMTGKQLREAREANSNTKDGFRDRYAAEEHRLNELFRADLEEQEGMKGHAKAEMIWKKAWERGHSSGYSEIAYVYFDLAKLVRD